MTWFILMETTLLSNANGTKINQAQPPLILADNQFKHHNEPSHLQSSLPFFHFNTNTISRLPSTLQYSA